MTKNIIEHNDHLKKFVSNKSVHDVEGSPAVDREPSPSLLRLRNCLDEKISSNFYRESH